LSQPQLDELKERRYALDDAAIRFCNTQRALSSMSQDQLDQWDLALGLVPDLRPAITNDQPTSTADRLGIENDATAIANVAAGRNTNLPLAFGIFGDWGAGKTFFMNMVRRRIANIVAAPVRNIPTGVVTAARSARRDAPPQIEDDGFEHAIVQIQFNAWHYAETNLWASLVSHIFEELDRWMTRESADGDPRKTVDTILKRLSTSRQLTLEAASELVQRRKEYAAAGDKLAIAHQDLAQAQENAAQAPLTVWRSAAKVALQKITGNMELRQALDTLHSTLGIPELLDDKAKLVGALDELSREASSGRATLAALQGTVGSFGTLLLALVGLVGVPVLLWWLPKLLAEKTAWLTVDLGQELQALGGLLTVATVFVSRFAQKAKSLSGQFSDLRKAVDKEIAEATAREQQEVSRAFERVARTQTEVDKAKTVMQATGDQVVAALRDYSEESGTQRILRFVRARAGADGYSKHLGLVSTIRRDFEQLELLMLPDTDKDTAKHLEQARQQYESRVKALIAAAGDTLDETERTQLLDTAKGITDAQPADEMWFRRIVLYIDDLDRCEPDKVVEVLQAVNMLLSLRLFVVMVAVDARWLSRSLETRYRDFFGVPKGDGDNDDRGGLIEPADYLEKIFQIPYWVPPMTADTSKALVGDLIAADLIIDAGSAPPRASAPSGRETGTGTSGQQQRAAEPEDEQDEEASDARHHALGLTPGEIDILTQLSPFLGGSPRRARRFVNVYRVAKASQTPAEITALERGGYHALATQLAIATGAPNAFSRWFIACKNLNGILIDAQIEDIFGGQEKTNIQGALRVYNAVTEDTSDRLPRLGPKRPAPPGLASRSRTRSLSRNGPTRLRSLGTLLRSYGVDRQRMGSCGPRKAGPCRSMGRDCSEWRPRCA
jgi:hypothetical protein